MNINIHHECNYKYSTDKETLVKKRKFVNKDALFL